MWLLLSVFLAFWFKTEIPRFAERTNRQIFQEINSLIECGFDERFFLAKSNLQPKRSEWGNLFFLLFPLIMWLSASPIIGLIFIILCFLSLLDICYYLTDVRYVILIFMLVLWQSLTVFHNETLFFVILFCLFITIFSQLFFNGEAFGSGDMLLLASLSPLFELEKMLLVILISSLSGILFHFGYGLIQKEKLAKLPFVPFISFASLCVI